MVLPTAPSQAPLPGGRGKGSYPVGPTETYRSIQEAIDALVADQGMEPFTATQKITVSAGVYEPFRIESDALRPTSEFRLVIEAEPDALPVISGRQNPSKSQVGCLIGNNVPYVTVQGLMFRDLIKGAVFGVNSHRPIVNRCFFLECGNVGVWFYQCDEGVLANSVLTNNDHGFVATLTRGFALLHNTFFNDTSFSRENKLTYCIFMDLQDDRGQGEEDTGRAYIYNNIICSFGESGLLLYEKDVLHVTSDYNDWYCRGTSMVEIREKVATTVTREYVRDLRNDQLLSSRASWCFRSGQDQHSISDDPGFIKPKSTTESAKIDLSMLRDSPVIGKGHVITTDLPVWIEDYTLVTFDFNGKSRLLDTCAIGAHEVNTRASWFGDEIFDGGNSSFFEPDGSSVTSAPADECEDDAFSFDKAAAAYAHAVPAWFPKIHRGRFYVRDHAYHLYVEKKAAYVRELQRTAFALPSRVIESGLKVSVAGRDVTDDTNWYVDGYTFVLYHEGLDFDYEETSDVEVEALHRYWDADVDAFAEKWIKVRWKLNEGVHQYVFPVKPEMGSPIVVTDDLIQPGNLTGLCQEFRTFYDHTRDEVRLEFGGRRNLWPNSDFSYVDEDDYRLVDEYGLITGYAPRDHRIEESGVVFRAVERFYPYPTGLDFSPVRGRYMLMLDGVENTTVDFVEQRLKVDPEKAYVLSAHGSAVYRDASIQLEMDFLNVDRQVIETHGKFTVPLPAPTTAQEWRRFGLSFYPTATEELGLKPFSEFAYPLTTGINMPAGAAEVAVRFYLGTGGTALLDAIQLEEGFRPGIYTRIPHGEDMTVEYESSDRRFYKVEDLTLQPVRNAHARGFISVIPVQARQWDEDAPVDATTLTDDWPWGRVNLLPWSKVSGFGNKYAHVPTFSTRDPIAPNEPIAILPTPALPANITTEPAQIVARQGSEGEIFSVEVLDQYRNPYAFERLRASVIEPTGEFPGYLAAQEWGFFTKLGQEVEARLDEAGTASLRWIPPEPEDIEYRGPKPTVSEKTVGGVVERSGYVDTWFRVNPQNHGCPTLRDEFGDSISLAGDMVTGNYGGQVIDDLTVLSLNGYPLPGSVEIFASRTGEIPSLRLLECFTAPIPGRMYQVNYEEGQVVVPGIWEHDFHVRYQKRLAWVNPNFPRRIYFDGSVLDLVTGNVAVVQYDALVDLLLEALPPTGMLESTRVTYVNLGIVAQHRDREVAL